MLQPGCNHEAPEAARHSPMSQGLRLPPHTTRVHMHMHMHMCMCMCIMLPHTTRAGATSSAAPSRGRSAATPSTVTRSSASASGCYRSSRTAGTPPCHLGIPLTTLLLTQGRQVHPCYLPLTTLLLTGCASSSTLHPLTMTIQGAHPRGHGRRRAWPGHQADHDGY